MNNVCYRKCMWNFNNRCVPETDSHYEDGTALTKNCTQFLHKDFFKNMENVLTECNLNLLELTNKQLRQARHAIKVDRIKCNRYVIFTKTSSMGKSEMIINNGLLEETCKGCENEQICQSLHQIHQLL